MVLRPAVSRFSTLFCFVLVRTFSGFLEPSPTSLEPPRTSSDFLQPSRTFSKLARVIRAVRARAGHCVWASPYASGMRRIAIAALTPPIVQCGVFDGYVTEGCIGAEKCKHKREEYDTDVIVVRQGEVVIITQVVIITFHLFVSRCLLASLSRSRPCLETSSRPSRDSTVPRGELRRLSECHLEKKCVLVNKTV